ncbi:MAG: hypothetical protein HQ534_13060 [Armatimonadetes bacterium]|nr:hypothetical protein [Armatimonadota bacterium]
MNMNLIYWILGIIVTIIVGYFGIKYTFKYKTRTRLLFFENSCFSLFKSVVKELDELEIKYKGKTVTENLIIYKGTFFNSGNIDIDKNLIYGPVKLILPDDYEWKKVKIIDQSEDVNLEYEFEKKPNELQFSWDILKENEFFTFDSVIEYKPEKSPKEESQLGISNITENLSKKITFSQRITNLKSIDIGKFILSSLSEYKFAIFGFLLVLIVTLLFAIFPNIYTYNIDTDKLMKDSILLEPGEVTIADSLADSFDENLQKILTSEKEKNKKLKGILVNASLFFGGLALVSLFFLLFFTNSYFKDKRLDKWIKQIDDKYI